MRPRLVPFLAICVLAWGAERLEFGSPLHQGSAGAGELGERNEAGAYPSDWFGLQRAFPYDHIPQDGYATALTQVRADRAMLARALADARSGRRAVPEALLQTAALTWTNAGPFNIGGRVTALAPGPTGTTVFLGAANGGVWKSTNSGTNWSPVFEEPYSIGALALEPGNPNVVYVGTGEANSAVDSYDGAGVFRSTDGGLGWASLGLTATRRIARIAVDPQNVSRIFVAAMGPQFSTSPDRGLYRSEDGGAHWSKVLFVSDSTGVTDVVINPAHPETVYAATWERIRRPTYRRAYGPESGIWRSVNHGTTWTLLAGGLPAPSENIGRIALALAPSRPSTIYAQIGSGIIGTSSGIYSGLGFYRSQDGGQTWTRRDTPGGTFESAFGGFVWYFGDMAVDPTNADVVWCLGQNLIRSVDAGANWSLVAGTTHPDFHALWIDPTNTQRVYTGNDGGFYSSVNGGGGWTKSVDLPITQFYAGTIDPNNSLRLLGGTQDNQCMQTTGSPSGWSTMLGGDGFYVLVDPTNSNIVLAEWQFCCQQTGPRRSTNGGTSFGIGPSGFVSTDRYNWCTPIAMDPQDHNVVVVGGNRVYRSLNNGVGYTAISPDLTANPFPPAPVVYNTISTVDISPRRSGFYYVGTDDGRVWRTLDGGTNWAIITTGLPLRYVTRVTADPAADSTVYVTLSGFGQDEHLAHVYRSTNCGTTWTSISGNLPDVPANDILVDPLNPSRLYLATDVGVYTTQNLGATWYPLGLGMPVQTVFDLSLHSASRTLVAATHGRSQWKVDLSSLPASVPPGGAGRLALSPPSPNPSRGTARATLDLPAPQRVEVVVFDVAGRRVRTLYSGFADAGRMSLSWDGFDARGGRASAGVYLLRARTQGAVETRRLVRVP